MRYPNEEHPNEEHPNAIRLDALAVGEHDAEAGAHVATCLACAGYMEAVARGAAAFTETEAADGGALLRAVSARVATATQHGARRGEQKIGPEGRSRSRSWIAGSTTVFALAAALLLYVRGRSDNDASEGAMRLKGGFTVSVIVDHGGVQSRRTGPLVLAPGDRLRLELALAQDGDIAAGVLADDGEWAELQAPALLTAGTHPSERSILFSGDVSRGWLIAGPVAAVGKGRQTRDFAGLVAIRLQGSRP